MKTKRQRNDEPKALNRLKKIKRIKTELMNKSSKKDDLSRNRPITLINSFYFFQAVWGLKCNSIFKCIYYTSATPEVGKILEVLVLEYDFGRTRTRTRTRGVSTRTRTRTRAQGSWYSYTYSSINNSKG